jgi:hypothetical protein
MKSWWLRHSPRPWQRTTVLIMSIGLFAGATPLLPAHADPPSLSGEVLHSNNGTSTGCVYGSDTISFTFSISGTASGPYPGTFSESGSVTFDRSTYIETFTANFTIDSSVGQVSGTKTSSATGITCSTYGEFFVSRSTTTYAAQIQTATGTFSDHGPTEAELCQMDNCFYKAGEWDLNAGQFREEYGPDVRPPAVKAPVSLFAHRRMLGTTSIPVRVRLSASDTSGISSYELQESTDGGTTFVDVPLPFPNAPTPSKTLEISPGSTQEFRVRATDGAGNRSAWVTGPEFSVRAFQETDPAITYSGVWKSSTVSSAYGGSLRYSGGSNSTATFSVPAGTHRFAWIAPRSPSRGMAAVYIDGTLARSALDLYSPTVENRSIVYFGKFSRSAAHTVQIRVLGTKNALSTGTRVDVDAFVTMN